MSKSGMSNTIAIVPYQSQCRIAYWSQCNDKPPVHDWRLM